MRAVFVSKRSHVSTANIIVLVYNKKNLLKVMRATSPVQHIVRKCRNHQLRNAATDVHIRRPGHLLAGKTTMYMYTFNDDT